MSSATRPLVIATAFAASLVVGLLVMFWAMGGVSKVAQPAAIGGPFQLTDQSGKTVTDKNLKGKPTLIFFGYTHCPDVCPTELQAISLALDTLGAAADAVQPLFITIDPERDTPARLADYVSSFHPRLIGLTGPLPAIRKTAIAYRVFFSKPGVAAPADYPVDHTGFIYLVGKDGRYLGFLPPGLSPDQIVEAIGTQLDSRTEQ